MFALLDKLTDPRTLNTIREESKTRYDGGKPIRGQSDTLTGLVHAYFPGLCGVKRGTSCFRAAVEQRIADFDFEEDPDHEQLKYRLAQIVELSSAFYDKTSSQRAYLVSLSKIFKKYWGARGEAGFSGAHTGVVRSILHADTAAVKALLNERKGLLALKLADRLPVEWPRVQSVVRELYDTAMSKDSLTTQDVANLLFCLETSAGGRKTAYLDPHITFTTFRQYKRILAKHGEAARFRIGHFSENDERLAGTIDDLEIGMDEEDYESQIGMEYVVVQIGVLKDSAEHATKYLPEQTGARALPRTVIKPTLVLTSREIVAAVKRIRFERNLTKKNWRGRAKEGNVFGTQNFHPIIKKHFPDVWAKVNHPGRKERIGSHFGRKIYMNASYEIYKDRVALITGKFIDRSVWGMLVLAHKGSLATSQSYATVLVTFPLPDEVYQIPHAHQLRLLMGQMGSVMKRVSQLERENKVLLSLVDGLQAQALATAADTSDPGTGELVLLKDSSGKQVAVAKRAGFKKFKTAQESDELVEMLVKRLREADVKPTERNIRALGVGSAAVQAWRKKRGLSRKKGSGEKRKKPELQPEEKKEQSAAQPPRPKRKKGFKGVPDELKGGIRAPDPKRQQVPTGIKVKVPEKTPGVAAPGQPGRDEARFGKSNVLLVGEACDGTEISDVNLKARGKPLLRDVCVGDQFDGAHSKKAVELAVKKL